MAALYGNAVVNAAKTHCPKGHPLSGDNLDPYALRVEKHRKCRTCHKARAIASSKMQNEMIVAASRNLGMSRKAYTDKYGWARHTAARFL